MYKLYTFGIVYDTILMIVSNFQVKERMKTVIMISMVLIDQK